MIPIVFLPTPDELAYNLDRLPKQEDEYKKAISSLATSVLDYSKQMEILNLDLSQDLEKKEDANANPP